MKYYAPFTKKEYVTFWIIHAICILLGIVLFWQGIVHFGDGGFLIGFAFLCLVWIRMIFLFPRWRGYERQAELRKLESFDQTSSFRK